MLLGMLVYSVLQLLEDSRNSFTRNLHWLIFIVIVCTIPFIVTIHEPGYAGWRVYRMFLFAEQLTLCICGLYMTVTLSIANYKIVSLSQSVPDWTWRIYHWSVAFISAGHIAGALLTVITDRSYGTGIAHLSTLVADLVAGMQSTYCLWYLRHRLLELNPNFREEYKLDCDAIEKFRHVSEKFLPLDGAGVRTGGDDGALTTLSGKMTKSVQIDIKDVELVSPAGNQHDTRRDRVAPGRRVPKRRTKSLSPARNRRRATSSASQLSDAAESPRRRRSRRTRTSRRRLKTMGTRRGDSAERQSARRNLAHWRPRPVQRIGHTRRKKTHKMLVRITKLSIIIPAVILIIAAFVGYGAYWSFTDDVYSDGIDKQAVQYDFLWDLSLWLILIVSLTIQWYARVPLVRTCPCLYTTEYIESVLLAEARNDDRRGKSNRRLRGSPQSQRRSRSPSRKRAAERLQNLTRHLESLSQRRSNSEQIESKYSGNTDPECDQNVLRGEGCGKSSKHSATSEPLKTVPGPLGSRRRPPLPTIQSSEMLPL